MTRQRATTSKLRCAFTLIECLAVIGVLAILLGLLLPAVNDAREAMRRVSCQNNLHQIGLGMHHYHSASSCFPVHTTTRRYDASVTYFGCYSQLSRMLASLDQESLFNSINFAVGTVPADTPGLAEIPTPQLISLNLANQTVSQTHLSILLCPSDSYGRSGAANSYRGNAGVGPFYRTDAEFPDSGNGVFPELGTISTALIRDGLSHTVAFSERLTGSRSAGKPQARRDSFILGPFVHTADDLMKGCRIASADPDRDTKAFVDSGRWWFWGGRERTLYSHTQPPNGRVADCTYAGQWTSAGMVTARSSHPGGVNALIADGSVRFVSDSINVVTWRALGTRNGAEIVD